MLHSVDQQAVEMPYRIVKNEVTFFASELIDTPP